MSATAPTVASPAWKPPRGWLCLLGAQSAHGARLILVHELSWEGLWPWEAYAPLSRWSSLLSFLKILFLSHLHT